ncbi:MAG: hypothetical protein N2594_04100 [Clostridiales bacterium]|nr:hypothetical protein [Clostridiales bacterium]
MFKKFFSFCLASLFLVSSLATPAIAKSKVKANPNNKKSASIKTIENKKILSSAVYNTKGNGTWLWNTRKIVESPNSIIKFLNENGFNEVYLQIDQGIDAKYYSYFIKSASSNSIKVYALEGNPNWILKSNRRQLDSFLNWVVKYNLSKSQDERFLGIHLDVEPYLLSIWQTNKNRAIAEYMDYIAYLKAFGAKNGLKIAVDIPFWFDEINIPKQKINLAEYVISQVDSINIMAYRDRAQSIIDIVKNEMVYGKKYNKNIVISVETGNTSEGENITFYQEGLDFMWNELNNVNEYYKNSYNNYSFAVHYLENIMEMKK